MTLMTDEQRIRELLEHILVSDCTPEDACAQCPELLPEVSRRLERMRRLDRQIDVLFPSSNSAAGGDDPAALPSTAHAATGSLPQIEGYDVVGVLGRGGVVLTNLLCNAAKFTDPGGHIRLTAAVEAGQLVLRVRDNGRGIAQDLLPRLFDLFYQVSAPGNGGTRGLGIGLALVKSLVELHGGSVAASSDGPGTGSEFVVCLPAHAGGFLL
jgi:hypothetical protein